MTARMTVSTSRRLRLTRALKTTVRCGSCGGVGAEQRGVLRVVIRFRGRDLGLLSQLTLAHAPTGYGLYTAKDAHTATWTWKTVKADGPGAKDFSDKLTITKQ